MNITNVTGLPKIIIDAILNDDYDHHNKGDKTYSATDLINPACYVELNRRYGKYAEEDASNRIWSLLGQATHSVMERASSENRVFEERLYSKKGEYTVSGKFDMYEDEIVYDFKVTSAWTIIYGSRMKDWTEQLNIYAKLLRESGKEVKGIKIIAILRDWNKTKSMTEAGYPKQQVQVIDIDLWTEEEQEMLILERLNTMVETTKLTDDEIEPCTAEERWQNPTKYAVMKGSNKRATKVFDTEKEAYQFIKGQDKPTDFTVEERVSVPTRCMDYCNVNKYCKFYREYAGIEDELPFTDAPEIEIEIEEDIF